MPDGFRLHGLRHHFASTLVSDGVDLLVVQKLLTHKDAKTTARYAHLAPGTIRDAALRSGDLLPRNQVKRIKMRRVITISGIGCAPDTAVILAAFPGFTRNAATGGGKMRNAPPDFPPLTPRQEELLEKIKIEKEKLKPLSPDPPVSWEGEPRP